MVKMLSYTAGVTYRPGAREHLARLIPGEVLTLCPEPTNKYDKNAVRVLDGEIELGYVPSLDSPAVAKALAAGKVVVCTFLGTPSTTSLSITWE